LDFPGQVSRVFGFFNSSTFPDIVKTPYTSNTLKDFLLSQPLTVDVEIDDEACGCFPVKCIEFEATVLYLGIHEFSRLSLELSPSGMLIYLNMFLLWTEESLESGNFCVVEKFLDNAVLLLFSKRFGSEDPFLDALRVARWIGEQDTLLFRPDIGIASGTVAAGFAGTARAFTASVFGRPVILAAGCAKMKPGGDLASCITFPAEEWGVRSFDEAFPAFDVQHPDKGRVKQPSTWTLGEVRTVEFPGSGRTSLRDVANFIHWMPKVSADKKAAEWLETIKTKGYFKNKR
jgi:hypothetical protein